MVEASADLLVPVQRPVDQGRPEMQVVPTLSQPIGTNGGNLVYGRTGVPTDRQNRQPQAALSVGSMGAVVQQGGGSFKAWHDPPIMLEQSVSEPHLEVDSEQETKTVGIPEARQTSDTGNVSLFVCGFH